MRRLALLFGLLWLGAASLAQAAGGLTLPDGGALFLWDGRPAVAVLQTLDRVALQGRLDGGKVGGLAPIPGLEAPAALTSDETGQLLVVDRAAKGYLLRKYRNGAQEGRAVELSIPQKRQVVGVGARNGILWLILRNPQGILIAAYDGQTLSEPTAKENFGVSPFSVAVNAAGKAYVTDPMGPAILSFTPSGSFEARIDLKGSGFMRPSGIAVDAAGALWVSDGVTGRVGRFTPENRTAPIAARAGSFDDPLRLFADPTGPLGVWVVESRPGRLTRMEETPR